MGLSISPVKSGIACCEAERRGWSSKAKARALGFLKDGEELQQVVNGRGIADDATLCSKVLCGECIVAFAQKMVYRKRLPVEPEELGAEISVADLSLKVRELANGQLHLDVWKKDKNDDWCIGAVPRPPRVRYEPALGYQTKRQICSWMICRFIDEKRKNALALEAGQRTGIGVISACAEWMLLGYTTKQLRRALHGVRSPEVAHLRKLAEGWLRTAPEGPHPGRADPDRSRRAVQQHCWEFHKAMWGMQVAA
jgi:hypothetical protein